MILEQFMKVVELYPDNIAVTTECKEVTFAELSGMSRKIAAKLKRSGVDKGDFITIEAERSDKYIAAMIGAWMINSAFAALDSTYPEDRLGYIAKDCNAKVRVDDAFFDGIEKEVSLEEIDFPKGEDHSLLVYTSGSTGKPKGVLHTHQSLFDACRRNAAVFGTENYKRAGEVVGEPVPFSFIAGLMFVFTPLIGAATVCIIPYLALRDPKLMARFVEENRINVIYMPPKLLKVFTPAGDSLKLAFTGSERATELYRDDLKIINGYGSSESAGGVLFFTIDKKYENTPIGKPTGDEKVYVLNENGEEAEEGELCLSGHFALGYLNNAEQTNEVFIANPYKEKDGFDVLYKTGDIVRKLPDGNILYLNRKDWMIKINGQRVEPGEIEQTIRDVDGIADAAVKDFVGAAGQTYICAYYVKNKDADTDEEAIKKAVGAKLPSYMMPAYFIALEKLPVNANGKLDRKSLKAPEKDFSENYVAPRNETEKILCEAFARALNIEKAGVKDDFFDLGGDSISVMVLQQGCPELPLSTRMIYDERTVENLAARLEKNADNRVIAADIYNESFPLTRSQMGIFISCEQREGEIAYNNPILFSFSENTDENRLKEAVEKTVVNHPGLLSKIVVNENGLPEMRYEPGYEKDICGIFYVKESDFENIKSGLIRPFFIKKERLFIFEIFKTEKRVYLFMDIHHVVFDGASYKIILPEILGTYQGKNYKKEDYTAFHAAKEESAAREGLSYAQAKEWYLKEFGDVEEITLPQGDKKEETTVFKGEKFALKIGVDALKNFCADNQVTDNVVATGAFGYLLSLYTMNKKTAFATVYNGRHDLKTARTVSMFVKTLPVLCDIAPTATIKDYLTKIKTQMLGAMVNDVYSFEELCSSTGYTSDILFTYQGDLFDVPKYGDLDIKNEQLAYNATGEKLSIQLYPFGGKLIFDIQYHGNIYSEKWVKDFAEAYGKVLSGFLSARLISDVSLVDEDDVKRLVSLSYGGELPFDENETYIKMLAKQVAKHPEKRAVVDKNGEYTYKQLDEISDKIANHLISQGVGKRDFVAIKMGRVKQFVAAIAGVLKAGAAYIPVDPTYPEDRVAYMTEDSKAKVVLTEESVDKIVADSKETTPVDLSDANSPAYMIYTSGSTGKPKGVVILNKSLTAAIAWRIKEYSLNEDSRNVAHPSFSFDASVDDLFPPLAAGGELHILSEQQRMDLDIIYEYLTANAITGMTMSTQIGMSLINAHPDIKLGYMVVGGEKLLPFAKTDVAVYNGYGPTEFTVCSSIHKVNQTKDVDIPIGRAVPNTYSFVCDLNGNLLPHGMVGELCLAGVQISEGYFGRPELNKERFVDCKYLKGQKMYRTGDLARYNDEGELEYYGRIDFQVKLRGFRIELGEIENVAAQFEGVQKTIALVKNKQLVLYYTADESVKEDLLKAHLAANLTDYMVPSVYMRLDEMPLNPSGKIDRRALPEPARSNAETVAPATEDEQKVFDVLADILGYDDFGVTDDFGDVGLTSLSAMQFAAKISAVTKKSVRMSDLGTYPTVRALAQFVVGAQADKKYGVRDEYPLTKLQEGIFVECTSMSGSTVYNLPLILKLDRSVDLKRLESAISSVVDAHPYLKMRLKVKDNGDVVATRDDTRKVTVRHIGSGEMTDGLNSLIKPFDLIKDQLLRIAVVSDGDDNYFFMDAHHIIFDGESLVVFMREVEDAYNGYAPVTETYTGFEVALDEAERAQGEAYQKAKTYYENLLGSVDTECLPIRDRDEGADRGESFSINFTVDKSKLSEFIGGGTTVNALWNTAFGLTLAKFLAREDCVYTTVYNGRSDARLINSVGMYVHTLPVVFNFANGETGKDTVRRIGRQLNGSMANDIYPFAEISRNLGVKANVMFVYEGNIGTGFTVGGKPAEVIRPKLDALKADLSVYVYETDTGYLIDCDYNARYYEEWSIRSLVTGVTQAFKSLIAGGKSEDITLLTAEEKARTDASTFVAAKVEDTDIVSLFRRAASSYPDNVAVIFRDKKIKYKELDKLTDKIAAYIQSLGIGKEDIVSILVPRSEYMVVAALGVLKSGAAYQPLDPSYPPERLNFMVSNAKAKLVVADSGLIDLISEYKGDKLYIEDVEKLADKLPADPCLNGGNLFIVLYTSGTTGTPKGVMLEHHNLVNFCDWYKTNYALTPESVVGAYASFGFDADMMDLYPALTTGAAVYIIPEDMRLDLGALDNAFASSGVTHLFMTTQMGRMFAENMKGESLSHLSVGGETLAPLDPPEGFALWNGYGPTECTIFSTIEKIDRRFYRNPIGAALPNYRLYVVDKKGNELPVGALGELWIAGAGVGRGYLDLPEQTKKTFIDNPFDNTSGFDRVYRTGDVVRRLYDGRIDFIGRNDGQVKIRGFRVELAEIESVIREYTGITNVTVQAFDDKAFGGKFLAAYVVADGAVDFGRLSEFIKSKKPPYMVPAAFMQLNSIPLNQNQKVNKRALPLPTRSGPEEKAKDLPSTPLESEICGVFASILGAESVGVNDNFFEIGGTSISAAKVAMFAANKNYPVVYKDIFDNPTARGLARHIENAGKDTQAVVEVVEESEHDEALKYNTLRYVNEIADVRALGRTLLAGPTGFLGSHVLKEMLSSGVETIVLCRGNKDLDAATRLSAMMAYYFDAPLDEQYGDILKVVDGDITNTDLVEKLKGEHIDTIINCAACVKHFAADDIIERINVGGVINLIGVAKAFSARLVHISTLSVAGENVDGKFPPTFRMTEDQLWFGQDISNKYVNSKFKAEQAILDEVKQGLDAKIIRVGNLMGRQSDGEFQINSITNSFIKSLRAYNALGYFPVSACDTTVDFSPVDEVARAAIRLAVTDKKFTVFHAANSHEVQMGDVIEAMNENGFDIKIVSDEVFAEKLGEMMKDEKRSILASSLLTYSSSDHHVYTIIKTDNTFSIKALYRLGFKWPITDGNYLSRIIEGLKSLDFFERDDI